MVENPDMIPILLTLTVRNPRVGELSRMLDIICNGKSGAWQLLQKWLARRGIKDYVRTVEVTLNHKAQSWHPHLHILAFASKDYFSRDNKNYISICINKSPTFAISGRRGYLNCSYVEDSYRYSFSLHFRFVPALSLV